MPASRANVLWQRLHRVLGARHADLSDRQLMDRFVARQDADAFALLLRRHGPMVLRVGRRILGHEQDVEDVFQATFLVLAKKAASLQARESVGNWLYGVACRLARRARVETARRRDREARAPAGNPPPDPSAELTLREAQAVLDEELARLPERYRAPLVLCCLEGRTRDEAARELGLGLGTVKSRLEQGRERLRRRLARRGLTLSAGLSAALLAEGPAPAAPLSAATTDAALHAAAGMPADGLVPARVLALAGRALQPSAFTRLAGTLALVLTLCAAGAGALALQGPPAQPAAAPAKAPEKPPKAEARGDGLPPGALRRFGDVRLQHRPGIRNSALSPDGKVLATASQHSVILWDLKTGKPLRHLPGDPAPGFVSPGLCFSPDGKHLGFVHGNQFACVWEVATGKQVLRSEEPDRWYAVCAFTPDGKQFTMSSKREARFWDLRSGKETHAIPAKDGGRLSPDARVYVRVDERKETLLVDVRTGKVLLRLPVPAALNGIEIGITFSPDQKLLALVDRVKRQVQVRALPGGKLLASFPLPPSARPEPGSPNWIYRVAFSHDGKTLLLGTGGGEVRCWDLATHKELVLPNAHAGVVANLHTLPDGRTLVSTGMDGLIRLWDRTTGRPLAEPEGYVGQPCIARSPDGWLVAVADARGRVDLWDAATGKKRRTLRPKGPEVTRLAFRPDGKLLAVGEKSGALALYEMPSGRPGKTLPGRKLDKNPVLRTLRFSPDGRCLCLHVSGEGTRLVDLGTGKVRWQRNSDSEFRFSPDGATLAVAFSRPELTFLDAATGKERFTLRLAPARGEAAHYYPIEALAWAPDGRWLAVGLPDGDIALCDTRTRAELARFRAVDEIPVRGKGHLLGRPFHRLTALAFSPDGKWLVSGGTDGAVRVWEAATRTEVLRRDGHEGEVVRVVPGPDARTVLSCGRDGQVFLWDLRPRLPRSKKVETLWADLAGEPARAYRAVWALGADPRAATRLLHERVALVPPPDAARLARWIADLDSDRFRVREAAFKELRKVGRPAAPAMQKALKGHPSLETEKRLRELLAALDKRLTPEELRLLRAVQAVERAGTPEARDLLRGWAGGAAGALLTEEARAALARMGGRRQPAGRPEE